MMWTFEIHGSFPWNILKSKFRDEHEQQSKGEENRSNQKRAIEMKLLMPIDSILRSQRKVICKNIGELVAMLDRHHESKM